MWVGSVSNMSRKTQAKRQSSVKPTNVNPNRAEPTTVKLTTVKVTTVNPTNVKPTNVNPLRTVPFEKGFHFYTSLGNYTGITATNLSEFAAKLQIVPSESVIFHSQRKDFQNWIRYTIKDATLAERMGKTKLDQSVEDLRKEVLSIVKAHTMRSF
jgi:hypothetical protein